MRWTSFMDHTTQMSKIEEAKNIYVNLVLSLFIMEQRPELSVILMWFAFSALAYISDSV